MAELDIIRDQREYWRREGEHWVAEAARYDAMNGPFGEAMLEIAALRSGERVVDVGCGNGATTIAVAPEVGDDGDVVGIDLSAPMLRLAHQRLADAGCRNVTLIEGDAQVHPFDDASFEAVISRFGTMFFAQPVAAFSNLHRALRPSGRLAIVVWQDMFQSEWIMVPGAAAAEHVGLSDFGPPGAPGSFALADRDRIRTILAAARFRDITIDGITRPMRIGDDADDATAFITSLSLVRENLFAGKPDDKVRAATDAARTALAAHEGPDGIIMNGGAWLVTARH